MAKINDITHINEAMKGIADSEPVATVNEIKQKTKASDRMAYIVADPYIENPSKLLGRIIEVRRNADGSCPSTTSDPSKLDFEFSITSLKGFAIDEQSKNSKPVLRGSIIVDNDLCGQVGFLNFLNGQLKQNETYSLIVMDQARGFVDFQNDTWDAAVEKWKSENKEKMESKSICYIFAITEFVQKNIIKKKYTLFSAEGKGGAYGVNIGGKLSTSTDEYSLDVIFGVIPSVIRRPEEPGAETRADEGPFRSPSPDELKVFSFTSGSKLE